LLIARVALTQSLASAQFHSTGRATFAQKGQRFRRPFCLRDELAVDRTLLANERTLLAYLRSGVALLIAGFSIMHFSTQGWFWAVGIAGIPAGIITGIVGMGRYRRI
jgi:putative membrane protein